MSDVLSRAAVVSRRERAKGQLGEQEVSRAYRERGFTVRGLEGLGDHAIVADPETGVRLHSEVKRQETARPWAWWAQAEAEAPPGSTPVVHFRRSRSPWLAMLRLADLLELLVQLRDAVRGLATLRALHLAADAGRWRELLSGPADASALSDALGVVLELLEADGD